MPKLPNRSALMAHLEALGIATRTVEHPAVRTVAESDEVEIDLPGAHTKNLFLKDKDGKLLLVVAKTSTRVDMKRLASTLGIGRLSFGKPELMADVLGVTPGSVTPFAIANDAGGRVSLILDNELTSHDSVNCHPLENTATTNIALADLLRFIRESGHDPKIMVVSGS